MSANTTLAVGTARRAVPMPTPEGQEQASIFVRGLAPAEISELLRGDTGDALAKLYTQVANADFSADAIEGSFGQAVVDLPDLVARAIAIAADLPDEWEEVRRFTLGAQADLLHAVVDLTFASEFLGKKLMTIIIKFVTERYGALLPSAFRTGSGT